MLIRRTADFDAALARLPREIQNWIPDKDIFGNDKVETDIFGNPKIETDIFGNQKIETDIFGNPIIPPKKK